MQYTVRTSGSSSVTIDGENPEDAVRRNLDKLLPYIGNAAGTKLDAVHVAYEDRDIAATGSLTDQYPITVTLTSRGLTLEGNRPTGTPRETVLHVRDETWSARYPSIEPRVVVGSAGRPEIGAPVHVRLGELLPRVDAWAAERNLNRAEAVRQLVASALSEQAPAEGSR